MRLQLLGLEFEGGGYARLLKLLSGGTSNVSAAALLDHVQQAGAKFALIESPYIDLDYSADYQSFYAGAFKEHSRSTQRLHLFSEDVSSELGQVSASTSTRIQAAYLGFVVIRPISHGPIGRTMVTFPELPGMLVRPTVRATAPVNLVGLKLEVTGAPFIQQEAKVGACAQATIWMSSVFMHLRHMKRRYSMAEITRLAITPADAHLSNALPAGSAGLSPVHMVRALTGMGYQPLFDMFDGGKQADTPQISSAAAEAVTRYLDSGLPVILLLSSISHAINAVGFVETTGARLDHGGRMDDFITALMVHDDQRGPYRLLPLRETDISGLPRDRLMMAGSRPMTVERDVSHMFVPLPGKVTLAAHRAGIVSRDFLKKQAAILGKRFMERYEADTGKTAPTAIEQFFEAVSDEKLVYRTYLTTAGRYRSHILATGASDAVKGELLGRTLPHFIWVTELLPTDSTPVGPDGQRMICGHLVVNASSSSLDPDTDLLIAHTPHLITHRDLNPPSKGLAVPLNFTESTVFIEDDRPYAGRVRSLNSPGS